MATTTNRLGKGPVEPLRTHGCVEVTDRRRSSSCISGPSGGTQLQGGVLAASQDAVLVAWFVAEVLYGPSAFWILADGWEDYERAMTVKLLRELEMPLMSGSPLSEEGA